MQFGDTADCKSALPPRRVVFLPTGQTVPQIIARHTEQSRGRRNVLIGLLQRMVDQSPDRPLQIETLIRKMISGIEPAIWSGARDASRSLQAGKIQFAAVFEHNGSLQLMRQLADIAGPR